MKVTGFKIMASENGKAISLADRSEYDIKKGNEIEMGGNGVYMSMSKEFVIDYYSGLSDHDDVILHLEFDTNDIIKGDFGDLNGEICVKKASIKNAEFYIDEELVPVKEIIPDFDKKEEVKVKNKSKFKLK